MDVQSFSKNTSFENLQKKENAELKYFCEAFSLIDSMMSTSMLLAFSNLVKESKDGRIQWGNIPDLFPEDAKSTRYLPTLQRIYDLIEEIVHKGWVTPMRIRSLGVLAREVHENWKQEAQQNSNTKKVTKTSESRNAAAAASKTWKDVSIKLKALSEFQDQNMAIHEDFQYENYLPNPNSWKVYLGTFAIIISGFCYSIFR